MESKRFKTKVGTWEVTDRGSWIATRFLDDFNLEKFEEIFPDSGINKWSYKWNIWDGDPKQVLKNRLKILL